MQTTSCCGLGGNKSKPRAFGCSKRYHNQESHDTFYNVQALASHVLCPDIVVFPEIGLCFDIGICLDIGLHLDIGVYLDIEFNRHEFTWCPSGGYFICLSFGQQVSKQEFASNGPKHQ